MSRFTTYGRLQTKKVLRTYPSMLLMTMLLSAVLGVLLYLQSSSAAGTMRGDEDSRLQIALVGLDTSPYLKTGIAMLQSVDSSKMAVSFVQMDQPEAMSALRKGEAAAVIIIPDGLIDNLLTGDQSMKMTLVLPGTQSGLGSLLIRELSGCISTMIAGMEEGSYALAGLYQAGGITDPGTISAAQTGLLKESIKKVFSRGHMFTVRRVKTRSALTIESYYLCAMFLLLVMLTGVMCAGSYIRTDYALPSLLHIRGLSAGRQILAEYLSLAVMMILIGAVFVPVTGLGLTKMPIAFAELHSQTPRFMSSFMLFCVRALPAVLCVCALDILLYELADSLISGVLLEFLVMIGLGYLSGIFYPVSSLPAAVQKISPFLPTGQALIFLRSLLKPGRQLFVSLSVLGLYAVLFLFLASLLRRRHLVQTQRS